MTGIDPFWNKVVDAADVVLRHPETELVVEFGDRRARVWAKVDSANPNNRELAVAIEVTRIPGVSVNA